VFARCAAAFVSVLVSQGKFGAAILRARNRDGASQECLLQRPCYYFCKFFSFFFFWCILESKIWSFRVEFCGHGLVRRREEEEEEQHDDDEFE